MDEEQKLEQIGLSKQEAIVYLNTLKMGLAKASEIAQKSNIGRGGSYYVLKLLKEKGFISEFIKSGVKYYNAAPPKKILEIIKEEKEKKEQIIKEILPNLEGLNKTALKSPDIEVFEGPEGFKTIFLKLLELGEKEFLCFLSPKILDYLPHFHVQFRKRRKEKNIHIKTITERTKKLEEIKKLDKTELRETRFLDKLFLGSDILNYITKDSMVVIKANEKEQIAIYIKEKEMATLYRNIFQLMWKIAKS